MWLSLLPWGFVVLGLLPLWMFPRQENLYPGVVFLIAALVLAATASLYSSALLGSPARFAWVLGLSILANVLGIEAARDLAQIPTELATAAAVASLMAGGVFLWGLKGLYTQPLATSAAKPVTSAENRDIMSYAALQSLAPSLESIAHVRPVTLLLVHTRTDQNPDELLGFVRQPDMIFQLKSGQFLIVLQGSSIEGAQIVFRRIRQNVIIRAYGVLPLHGTTVQQALVQLEGELQHYYLTQH